MVYDGLLMNCNEKACHLFAILFIIAEEISHTQVGEVGAVGAALQVDNVNNVNMIWL